MRNMSREMSTTFVKCLVLFSLYNKNKPKSCFAFSSLHIQSSIEDNHDSVAWLS